jgi:hypothetical protein
VYINKNMMHAHTGGAHKNLTAAACLRITRVAGWPPPPTERPEKILMGIMGNFGRRFPVRRQPLLFIFNYIYVQRELTLVFCRLLLFLCMYSELREAAERIAYTAANGTLEV